jgi:hypothetical protein
MKALLLALVLGVATSLLIPGSLRAQDDDAQVATVILHDDSLFWQAYNDCNLQGMKVWFMDDVEFYHDKGGITLGIDSLVASMKKGPCYDRRPISTKDKRYP